MYLTVSDHFFRFLRKRTIPIKEIDSVGISSEYRKNLNFTNETLVINIDHTSKEQVSSFWLTSKNPKDSSDLIELKNILINLGVKPYIQKIFTPLFAFYIFFMIVFVLTLIKELL